MIDRATIEFNSHRNWWNLAITVKIITMVVILCIEISYIKALGLYEFMRGLDGFVNWWVRVGVGVVVGGGIGGGLYPEGL